MKTKSNCNDAKVHEKLEWEKQLRCFALCSLSNSISGPITGYLQAAEAWGARNEATRVEDPCLYPRECRENATKIVFSHVSMA